MLARLRRIFGRWRNSSGATAMEYALIASAIALAISIPLIALGDGLLATYEVIGSLMTLI